MGKNDFSLKIDKIKIQNFRGIKYADFKINDNTVIVGQNNVGKSTIIAAISKFSHTTNIKNLQVSDFNIGLLKNIYRSIQREEWTTLIEKTKDEEWTLIVELRYKWKNLPEELMDFISELSDEGYISVRTIVGLDIDRFQEMNQLINAKKINEFFKMNFQIRANQDEEWEEADSNVKKVMFPTISKNSSAGKRLYYIKATRRVEDGDSSNNNLAGKIFNDNLRSAISEDSFQSAFFKANNEITQSLKPNLKTMNSDLKDFSFPDNSLKNLELLPDFDTWLKNPTLRLSELVEDLQVEIPLVSQGLGYQNIFNILSQLSVAFDELGRTHFTSGAPHSALFVIEEPEVYTHPQLQHVFIQNLINYIDKYRKTFDIQTLIISHSAEVAVSAIERSNKFSLIRVSKLDEKLIVKNWEEIDKGRIKSLILNYNSEILFAEKVILIEGDAERAMITAMMRKMDKYCDTTLLSQQIAIIPVGNAIRNLLESLSAMSFKKIVYFTDLDFARKDNTQQNSRPNKVYDFNNANCSTNSTINTVFLQDGTSFKDTFKDKTKAYFCESYPEIANLKVFTQGWIGSKFLPNTLEPAILNAASSNRTELKVDKKFDAYTNDIKVNKVSFAFDTADAIDYANVEIPEYIKQGLIWLDKKEI